MPHSVAGPRIDHASLFEPSGPEEGEILNVQVVHQCEPIWVWPADDEKEICRRIDHRPHNRVSFLDVPTCKERGNRAGPVQKADEDRVRDSIPDRPTK